MAAETAELSFGFEQARRAPAATHVALVLPALHVAASSSRAIEIIDSIMFVQVSVRARVPSMPKRRTVNMSSRPSRSDPAASGWVGRARRRAGGPCAARGAGSGSANAPRRRASTVSRSGLRQVIGDVSPLVDAGSAARRARSPNTARTAAARALAPSITTSRPPVGVQAPLDEVGQQGGHDRLVLGVADPQPDRDLRAVAGDDQGDDAARAGEVDAVDHQHRRRQARQVPGQQGVEGGLGAASRTGGTPPTLRRGAGRPPLRRSPIGSATRSKLRVATPGQHPFQHRGGQQVAPGEHPERLKGHLAAAAAVDDRMHPRPADREPLAAHHHRRRRRPAPLTGPLGRPGRSTGRTTGRPRPP